MLAQRLSVDAARTTFSTAACVVTRRSACPVLHHQIFRRQRITEGPSTEIVSIYYLSFCSMVIGYMQMSSTPGVVPGGASSPNKLLPVRTGVTGLVAKSISNPEMFRYSTAASCTCALLAVHAHC